jgi:hypothetical protein
MRELYPTARVFTVRSKEMPADNPSRNREVDLEEASTTVNNVKAQVQVFLHTKKARAA